MKRYYIQSGLILAALSLACILCAYSSMPAKPREPAWLKPSGKPPKTMSRFHPGQKVVAFNEDGGVWIDRVDGAKWDLNDLGNHGFPIIPSKTELEVISDTKEPADEYRLVRVLIRQRNLVLDTGDGHFAPGEIRDHECCVARYGLRDAATLEK